MSNTLFEYQMIKMTIDKILLSDIETISAIQKIYKKEINKKPELRDILIEVYSLIFTQELMEKYKELKKVSMIDLDNNNKFKQILAKLIEEEGIK